MLLYPSFREDLVEQIENSDPALFESYGKSKKDILADKDLIDRMWGVYQKDIEDYSLEAPDAFRDTELFSPNKKKEPLCERFYAPGHNGL